MIVQNPKAQSGTINSLVLLNHQKVNNNNKSFNIIDNNNNLKTFEENSNGANNIGIENNITNTDESRNIIHKKISKELLSDIKMELNKDIENKENNNKKRNIEIKEIHD